MDIDLSVIRRGIPFTPGVVVGQRVRTPLEVPAGEELAVDVFDTVRVDVAFEYLGGGTVTLYGAIGSRQPIVGFIEHCAGEAEIVLPPTAVMTPFTASVDILVRAISAATYNPYVKILEAPGAGQPELSDVITVAENYEEVQHTIYPWRYTYEGPGETCTFEFRLTPEQVPGTEWLGDRVVDAFAEELQAAGSRLLELKVSRDTTPTLWTNYLLEVTATVEEGTAGTIAFPWGVVIVGVLAILFIVAIVWAIRTVDRLLFKRSPLSDETKALFDRHTVGLMVLDLKPETPQEEMDALSDEDLRHLLNETLAEIQPPGLGGAAVAIAVAGALAVGVVGAAFAFSGPRRG